jgi:multiple sugar transport system permease protein
MSRAATKSIIYIILTIFALVWVFPLVTTFLTVIKSPDNFAELSFWQLPELKSIPKNLSFNFGYALEKAKIARDLFNSLLYAVVAGSGSAFIAGMAAYALVFLDLKRPQSWFIGIFIGNLFPFQMFLIPLYLFLSSVGLFDTRLGLTIVYVGICVPFALFVYRNYAFTIPREIFDASKVDGASTWGAFFRIFLPMSVPAFTVVFIFQFIWTWNDLLFGLVLSERFRPVMTALSKLIGSRGGVPATVYIAGAVFAAIPTVIILLTLQKQFVRGFTITAEK